MKEIVLLSLLVFLSACASTEVNEDRAGCYYGKARYGSLTQYVKGNGVHVYVGNNLKKVVKITCNKDVQEIILSNEK